jgi:hypothetical protein
LIFEYWFNIYIVCFPYPVPGSSITNTSQYDTSLL